MRRAIHAAAERLGPCWSISHLVGGQGQVLRIIAGHPERVQDLLASEAKRRFQAPAAPAADIIVAGNHPWPGDPMQSFKVLLASPCGLPAGWRAGRAVLDRPDGNRSFVSHRRAAADRCDGSVGRVGDPPVAADRSSGSPRPLGSPAAFMLRWARELVVDRTVLVYSPPLHERIGPRLGPVRLFADQAALWQAAAKALARDAAARGDDHCVEPVRCGSSPRGG